MTHTEGVTQRLKAIPPERLSQKIARTIGGVCMALAGAGLSYAVHRGFLGHNVWIERVSVALLALGCFTASFEIVRVPLDYAVALARDIAKIVRGKNGDAK